MSPPKYTTYELKLTAQTEDGAEVVAFLTPRLPDNYTTIAGANAVRRAVATLFGDKVTCKVESVRRIPARTRRRVLRI